MGSQFTYTSLYHYIEVHYGYRKGKLTDTELKQARKQYRSLYHKHYRKNYSKKYVRITATITRTQKRELHKQAQDNNCTLAQLIKARVLNNNTRSHNLTSTLLIRSHQALDLLDDYKEDPNPTTLAELQSVITTIQTTLYDY